MIWDILFKVWKKGSSFNGENEYISVSNSVIILDGKDKICYGGDLKERRVRKQAMCCLP